MTLLLTSCAAPGPENKVVRVIDKTDQSDSASRTQSRKQYSAVSTLIKQAQALQQKGQSARAAATLERALRIQSDNPDVWFHLAQVRFSQKRYQQAEAMALRSSQYVRGNTPKLIRNWELILAAREKLGHQGRIGQARKRLKLLRETR